VKFRGRGVVVQESTNISSILSIIGAFILMPVEYPEIMKVILERLGMTLSPLALMSVGYQLHFERAEESGGS
jgi:predicted permease